MVNLKSSKKNIKDRKFKISKFDNVILLGPCDGEFRTSLKTFGCDVWERRSAMKFLLPLGPMLQKKLLNFHLQKFKIQNVFL